MYAIAPRDFYPSNWQGSPGISLVAQGDSGWGEDNTDATNACDTRAKRQRSGWHPVPTGGAMR